jgi:hypothetical protein
MTNEDKLKAKSQAIKEVESRITTKEQAKQDFKSWLKKSLKFHKTLYSRDVVEFWEEVEKQVDLY